MAASSSDTHAVSLTLIECDISQRTMSEYSTFEVTFIECNIPECCFFGGKHIAVTAIEPDIMKFGKAHTCISKVTKIEFTFSEYSAIELLIFKG